MGDVRELAATFPGGPGVYLMKDESGKIIYVGKALNLKRRVGSYFTGRRDPKTVVLVGNIADIEYIVTESEYEALLLENILIKKWTPRYNIRLKDGKSYPVVRVTNEDFPRVFRTRRIVNDGSKYYGPFPSSGHLAVYMETIEKMFPLRKCRGPLKKRKSPCLYYHIGRCTAPCTGMVTVEEYRRILDQVEELLSGDNEDLAGRLRELMQKASEELQFEKAAGYRDAMAAAERLSEESEQKIVDFNSESRDYISAAADRGHISFAVFHMRDGRLSGRELFRGRLVITLEEAVEQFSVQYYSEQEEVPDSIHFLNIFDKTLLADFLARERKSRPGISFHEKGRDFSVLKMAEENARRDLEQTLREGGDEEGLESLRQALSLEILPRRIEGFDIAQLSGKHPVASLVSFLNGRPDKKNYRHFHIKTLGGQIDDFAAVREAVSRRYSRLINEEQELPDLVLIDGGKGQVSAARGVLDALGLENLPVAGLAKKNEEIFLPHRSAPVLLPAGDPGLRILQFVRDETHRFATGFNQKLRQQGSKFSMLEEIPGIGPARSRRIMEVYGSLDAVKAATAGDISMRCGIPINSAEILHKNLTNAF